MTTQRQSLLSRLLMDGQTEITTTNGRLQKGSAPPVPASLNKALLPKCPGVDIRRELQIGSSAG